MPNYPEDSIQCLALDNWWVADDSKVLRRGMLIETYVQFYYQVPFQLVAERVDDPDDHTSARFAVHPLNASGRAKPRPSLPVAAVPQLEGADCFVFNRAKKRPCLVLGAIGQKAIDRQLTHNMSKASTAPFFLVAPFFGVPQKGRGGYNAQFVERVMHAEYAAFFWDILPHNQGCESILRLDQIQPVGLHHQSYKYLEHRLSEEAMIVMDEWMDWIIYGRRGGEFLSSFHALIAEQE